MNPSNQPVPSDEFLDELSDEDFQRTVPAAHSYTGQTSRGDHGQD